MRSEQLTVLLATGHEMLEKSRACTKVSDCSEFVTLGLKCLAEAREIEEGMKRNSVALFLEFSVRAKEALEYNTYLDFCARNSLDTISKHDYDVYIFAVWQTWKGVEAGSIQPVKT